MWTRQLGQSGLEATVIGLGCMGMSQSYGGRNDLESSETLVRAVELGITYFDTADMYGKGHNETLLGMNLQPSRDKILIGTKCGFVWKEGETADLGIDNSPDYIRACCDASLQRLRTDRIDLYFLHRINPEQSLEDALNCLVALKKAGKIRAIGLSEVSAATLRRAHAIAPIDVLQSEYSLWQREPEIDVLPTCRELGITFMAFAPIGRGFLSGLAPDWLAMPESDFRRNLPRFQPGNADSNRRLVEHLQAKAAGLGVTAAQLSLAWLLTKPGVVAIPGTRRVKNLEENFASAEVILSEEQVAELDAMFPIGAASGARYPESELKRVNV